MNDAVRLQAAEMLRSGVSQAETARRLGVDKTTVHRWVKAGLLTQSDEPAHTDFQSEAATGLAGLVPKALELLEQAIDGSGAVPAQKARVALDIIKAAAGAGKADAAGGDLARRIQEMGSGTSD